MSNWIPNRKSKTDMIAITGAAGFIGSRLAEKINETTYRDLLLADNFKDPAKAPNWEHLRCKFQVYRDYFPTWIEENGDLLEVVFHLGARTDTAETDPLVFDALNFRYSQALWKACARHGKPFFYASSAATYGAGEQGYDDSTAPEKLRPLNAYGRSKNDFDAWALAQKEAPPVWAGFKFFNVYGPGEAHKGRMASVVWHTYRQVRETGQMQLFRSHRPDFPDGGQQRDFVYVGDVVDVLLWAWRNRPENGLYNLGTGEARTFLDLAGAVFEGMRLPPRIEFVDIPADIRDSYQYYTKASLDKLRAAGYTAPFTSLEAGVARTLERLP
jgi:ADP-L-glycero-D-manno-heptose 6-epimerase